MNDAQQHNMRAQVYNMYAELINESASIQLVPYLVYLDESCKVWSSSY